MARKAQTAQTAQPAPQTAPQTAAQTDTAPQTSGITTADIVSHSMADCKAALFKALDSTASAVGKRKEDNKQNGESVKAAYERITDILKDILYLLPNRMDILPWCETLINDSFSSGGDSNRNKEKRDQLAKGLNEVLNGDLIALAKQEGKQSCPYGKGLYLVKPAGAYLFMVVNLPKPPSEGEKAMDKLVKACTAKGAGTNWMAVEAAILEMQDLLKKQRTDRQTVEKVINVDSMVS